MSNQTHWISADYHFAHHNIIRYCKRPFKDTTHMQEAIIKNIKNKVHPNDTLFFLGDFAFHTSVYWYIDKIGCNISFVKGNHDAGSFFKSTPSIIVFKKYGKMIQMTHDPTFLLPNCDINLCGHAHEKWKTRDIKGIGKVINVGVDVWNFQPVSLRWLVENNDKIK